MCKNSYFSFKTKEEYDIETEQIDNESDIDVTNETDSKDTFCKACEIQDQAIHKSLKTVLEEENHSGPDCTVICAVSNINDNSPKKSEQA